jgi:hypothetical protein
MIKFVKIYNRIYERKEKRAKSERERRLIKTVEAIFE